jgi:hypothetical protein
VFRSINRLGFVAEMQCVSCEVRTNSYMSRGSNSVFKGLNKCCSHSHKILITNHKPAPYFKVCFEHFRINQLVERFPVFWNPIIQYRLERNQPMDPILSHYKPLHILVSHYIKIHSKLWVYLRPGVSINICPSNIFKHKHFSTTRCVLHTESHFAAFMLTLTQE